MKRISTFLLIVPFLLASCTNNDRGIIFLSSNRRFLTYYRDSYFFRPSSVYSQQIAVASFASAMAGCDEDGKYETYGTNLSNLWKKEGFSNIYINDDYKVRPTMDSVGFGIASKKISEFNLVAVTIRSDGYEAEWASNFTIGTSGHSKGFDESSDIVINGLFEYIDTHNITGLTKIWITGYSRGAAITNIAAGKILQSINDGTYPNNLDTGKDDVYAYCFEPPSGACTTIEEATSDLYNGIHNILNYNDLVPTLAPYDWGFVHYGKSHYFPDRITDIYFNSSERKKMVSNYHFSTGAHNMPDYSVDDWKFYKVDDETATSKNLPVEALYPSQGRFAHQFVHTMMTGFINRENYATLYESSVRNMFAACFGINPVIGEMSLAGNVILDIVFSYSFVQTMLLELQEGNFGGFAGDVEFLFYLILNANKDNIDEIKSLYEGIYYFLTFLGPSIVARNDLMLQFFSRDNLINIIAPHYFEFNYSFLKSCDSRLYGSDACKFNDGTYQILHVKNPTSVKIYETHLKKRVFTFINGTMSSDTLAAEKLADGSLNIFLPNNGEYKYNIEASEITLSKVNEYGEETIFNDALPLIATINQVTE